MSIYERKSLRKSLSFVTRVRIPLGSQWLMLVITGVVFVLVATFVDLTPVVDQNFFFSTNDPGIQQTKKIEQPCTNWTRKIFGFISRVRPTSSKCSDAIWRTISATSVSRRLSCLV